MQVLKPPKVKLDTDQSNKTLYTVKKTLVPFTWRIRDRTTLISFKKLQHAITIASSLEAHYYMMKMWPDMTSDKFELTYGPMTVPNILDIYEESLNDVREYCALWNLGLLIVDEIGMKENTILFSGDLGSFEISNDIYVDHLENIYEFGDGTQA